VGEQKVTRMFDKMPDPYLELQTLRQTVTVQQQQITELQHYLEEASKHINQHAKLIKQITEQNTEILLLWANTTSNFNNK
jgi:DNA mismatch repair ATPase MutS